MSEEKKNIPNEQLDEIFDGKYKTILDMAKTCNIELHRARYEYGFSFDHNEWTYPKVKNFSIVGSYSYCNKDAAKFKEEVKKLFETEECAKDCLKLGLNPKLEGMKLPKLCEVVPVIGSKSRRKPLELKRGFYNLLYIWNSKISRCYEYTRTNDELLDRHPEWSGRLRLLEISTDDDLDGANRAIKGKSWERIDHYWVNKKNVKDEFWTEFLSKDTPYYILTDRDGYIVAAGDPEWISLEKNLENWMEGEIIQETYLCEEDTKRYIDIPIKDPNFTFKGCFETAQTFVANNESRFDKMDYLSFSVDLFKLMNTDGTTSQFGEMIMRYNYYEKFKDFNLATLDTLRKAFEGSLKVADHGSTRNTATIEFGKECCNCKISIVDCDQYRCVVCDPPIYYCLNCLKQRDNIKSKEDLVHEHAFFYIQKDSQEVLDELRIIRVKVSDVKSYKMGHSIYCKMCCKNLDTDIAWKCAVCGDSDFCDACFKISKDENHPDYEKVCTNAKRHRHDPKTHIYVREDVCGQLGFYY